jgi:hypothetical protein
VTGSGRAENPVLPLWPHSARLTVGSHDPSFHLERHPRIYLNSRSRSWDSTCNLRLALPASERHGGIYIQAKHLRGAKLEAGE